jgi:hypothetical protein
MAGGRCGGRRSWPKSSYRCRTLLMEFDHWWLKHIPREKNKLADWLVCKELGHDRATKKTPKVELVDASGPGRPGWPELGYVK